MANTKPIGLNSLPKGLQQKLLKKSQQILDVINEDIIFEIESHYESAISDFYNDYTPYSYNRTCYTYYGSDAYDSFYKNIKQVKGGYKVGIHVSADNIPGNPYNAKNKEWVFNRTFTQGIHGYTKEELQEWETKAHEKGKGFSWRFIAGQQEPMKPSPKKIMDDWFKDFRKTGIAPIVEKHTKNK